MQFNFLGNRMAYAQTVSGENQSTLLDFLKSLHGNSSSVDITVKKNGPIGLVQVRQGWVAGAECGTLSGNGAFLTLLAAAGSEYEALASMKAVAGKVTLSLSTAEKLCASLLGTRQTAGGEEEAKLRQAVHLLYQFRRKEAGALLVEILRANRFFYPAWLWHSRLMTREEYIRKALNEAKKWGNCDSHVQQEAARIEAQLLDPAAVVKRCIFCWSVVKKAAERCVHCRGMFQVLAQTTPQAGLESPALEQALAAYSREWNSCPTNALIAFCLCLGFYSLGRIDQAREYAGKALQVAPQEPLFVRTKSLLDACDDIAIAPVVKPATIVRQRVTMVSPGQVPARIVLVVEDSQTSRKVITMLLTRKGYGIQEAKNGEEALAKLSEGRPDLVLLDLMLPDMSGYDVLAKVRNSPATADIPVIMLTGKSNPADRMKGLHHGSNEYVTKPFDPAKLLAILENYLDRPLAKRQAPEHPPAKVITKMAPPVRKPLTPAPQPALKHPTAWAVTPQAPAAPAPRRDAGEKSILVVEGSPTSRRVLAMVIAKRGYTVNEAATGAVAVRKAREMIPSLVLLDAMLPDVSGYDILHFFKSDPLLKDVPVVMLTAKGNAVDRQKGLKGGAVAYLAKPFDPERLLTVIDEHIR
jgi:twitching motility two-component system response regulator PilG